MGDETVTGDGKPVIRKRAPPAPSDRICTFRDGPDHVHVWMPPFVALGELERPQRPVGLSKSAVALCSTLAQFPHRGLQVLETLVEIVTVLNGQGDQVKVVSLGKEPGPLDVSAEHLPATADRAEGAKERQLAKHPAVKRDPVAVIEPLAEAEEGSAAVQTLRKVLVAP